MSPEDIALFQQAIEVANSGQKQAAYEQFCFISRHEGNAEDVTLLYWLAFTTPSPLEFQRALAAIARIEPTHPKLQDLYAYQARKWQQQPVRQMPNVPIGPVLTCPFCGMRAPALIKTKVSTGGWITLVVLLIVFFPLFWVGFLIREDYRACGYCGSKLG
jgi:DNA-directed RNA polymerase subunit RPC12/RpoP